MVRRTKQHKGKEKLVCARGKCPHRARTAWCTARTAWASFSKMCNIHHSKDKTQHSTPPHGTFCIRSWYGNQSDETSATACRHTTVKQCRC